MTEVSASLSPAPQTLPSDYINRELSLLQFHLRVLAQAVDPLHPLLERMNFLLIFSRNLDEFFEIRVAGLMQQLLFSDDATGPDGLRPSEVLSVISEQVHAAIARQYQILNEDILPALAQENIRFLRREELSEAQSRWVSDYFREQVLPVLTPISLDPAHPFPRLVNKSLNFIVTLEGKDAFGRNMNLAIVPAPRSLPRVVRLPDHLTEGHDHHVMLSAIIHEHVSELFPGMTATGCHQFRVTRNSDMFVDEEEVKDLRATLKGELQQRHYGDAVRLEIADNCSEAMASFLMTQFGLVREDVYRVPGMVNPVRLNQVPDWVERPDLKYRPFRPARPKGLEKQENIFRAIRRQDILLHHPFQSFEPVIELLKAAADDADVVAVKMTVYRTGTDSVLMEHLVRAAQKGKEVTVVLELMARFDEEANISWAARLEEVGAHVVYGVFGYKTHAKMLLLVRREEGTLRRYAHLGTGNYHPRTTRFYTDFGLLTANEEIGADVAEVFKQLTGLGQAGRLRHLWQAPFTLQPNVVQAIKDEAEIARAGRKGRIIVKVNALLEPQTIEALYEASQAGVEIDVIARSVCALKPGVVGLSENIRVRSVVGRFLEHHRIFYFGADGADKLYLSSADWMERNFFKRIEVAFPILDPKVKRRVMKEGLRPYLGDNCQAWELGNDNQYRRKNPRTTRRSAQEILLKELSGMQSA